jgi:alkyl hydroperoxide reductase subunit AhpC
MLTVGDTFPAFALRAVKGGPEGLKLDTAFTEITSATDEGKWKLVFFWPKGACKDFCVKVWLQ